MRRRLRHFRRMSKYRKLRDTFCCGGCRPRGGIAQNSMPASSVGGKTGGVTGRGQMLIVRHIGIITGIITPTIMETTGMCPTTANYRRKQHHNHPRIIMAAVRRVTMRGWSGGCTIGNLIGTTRKQCNIIFRRPASILGESRGRGVTNPPIQLKSEHLSAKSIKSIKKV